MSQVGNFRARFSAEEWRDYQRKSLQIDLRQEIESILEVDDDGPRLTETTVYVDAKYAPFLDLWQHDEGGADGESFLLGVSLDEWPLVDAYARKPRIVEFHHRPRVADDALAFDVELEGC